MLIRSNHLRNNSNPSTALRQAHKQRLISAAILAGAVCCSSILHAEPEPDPALDCVINPSVVADLGSGVPGIIDRVMVDRSDFVEAGQIVAELESGVEIASRDLARAKAEKDTEIDLRRVNAAFGQRQHARSEDLFARKVISTNDRDERKTEARLAGIQLRQARDNKELALLELKRAEHILKRRTIKSPISGVVMDRFKTIGEYVDEQPVLRVAQLDPLFIEVFVPVDRLGEVQPGMRAEVWSDAVSDQRWQAEVSRVDRVADVASGTYGVRLVLPNPEFRVPAGLRCRLAFSAAAEPAVGTADATDSSTEGEPTVAGKPPDDVTPAAAPEAQDADAEAPRDPPPAEPVTASAAEELPMAEEPPMAEEARLPPVKVEAVVVPVQQAPAEEANADPLPAAVPEQVCLRSGPYPSRTAAGRVARELKMQGLDAQVDTYQESEKRGIRVVSRWFSQRSHAEAFVTRLEQAEIRDFFLAPGRRLPLRVNLGLYKNEKLAAKRIRQLKSKGIEANAVDWMQRVTRYALTVSGQADEATSRHLAELPSSTPASCDQLASSVTP